MFSERRAFPRHPPTHYKTTTCERVNSFKTFLISVIEAFNYKILWHSSNCRVLHQRGNISSDGQRGRCNRSSQRRSGSNHTGGRGTFRRQRGVHISSRMSLVAMTLLVCRVQAVYLYRYHSRPVR